MGRILGVDVGEKRIGFAASDPMRIIASANEVVTVQNQGEAANVTARKVRELDVDLIVIGLPKNMDNSEGPAAAKARAFAELLAKKTAMPIVFWDERLSTKSAHDILLESGMRNEKRRGIVDKVAAQILLQNYLDAHSGDLAD
jgi:putative Holliday junction resolvase